VGLHHGTQEEPAAELCATAQLYQRGAADKVHAETAVELQPPTEHRYPLRHVRAAVCRARARFWTSSKSRKLFDSHLRPVEDSHIRLYGPLRGLWRQFFRIFTFFWLGLRLVPGMGIWDTGNWRSGSIGGIALARLEFSGYCITRLRTSTYTYAYKHVAGLKKMFWWKTNAMI
jgi:hypothetical protein